MDLFIVSIIMMLIYSIIGIIICRKRIRIQVRIDKYRIITLSTPTVGVYWPIILVCLIVLKKEDYEVISGKEGGKMIC